MPTNYRQTLVLLRRSAGVAVAAGGLAVLAGAALPWARLGVLGVAVELPGVAFVWGGVAAFLGLASLTGAARRWPLVTVVLGLAALGVGLTAGREAGRAVAARILAVEDSLAPVNARLAEVSLPPVEPFGGTLSPWRDYVGPGPCWVAWGGAAVALGGALRFGAGRAVRTCRRCGTLWRPGRDVAFCPSCGGADGPAPAACPRCWREPEPGDRFCSRCGSALGATPPPPAAGPAPGSGT